MAYITITDISGIDIPLKFLNQALDDNGDGAPDSGAFDAIAQSASDDVDGLLNDRFNVPFLTPIPPIVFRATKIFFLEKLYLKRGITENPWTKKATEARETLRTCGKGILVTTPKPSATAITERSRTHSRRNNLMI